MTDVSDHELLLAGLWEQVEANRLDARRLARWEELRCRRARDVEARRAEEPHFTLTPLQETTVEVGELWAADPARISSELGVVGALKKHFPDIWAMCLRGELDLYRAGIVADAARHALDHVEEFGVFADRLTAWLAAGRVSGEGRPTLVSRTPKQVRNKVNYELNRLKSDPDEQFRKAFKDRRTSLRDHADGMGSLSIGNSIDQVRLADYRLTLAAQVLRSQGDERTLDQLRADLAVDLILGRRRVEGTIADLEARATGNATSGGVAGAGGPVSEVLPLPRFARPIINVTVPIQTLMGVGDAPGVLSGGGVVPASLARQLAQRPGSTWYRMLTDPTGSCVELSTTSYRPTEPIWRDVVARFNTCYRPGCTRPATECEVDHRVPWPHGSTSADNLQPGCRRDHKAKHAPGFSVEQAEDGSLVLTTAAGFEHRTAPAQHPTSDEWPREDLFHVQFSATEFTEALAYIRFLRALDTPPRNDLVDDALLVTHRG